MVKIHNNKRTLYAANHSMIKNAIYYYTNIATFMFLFFPPPRSAKKQYQFGCESLIGVRRSTVVYLILRTEVVRSVRKVVVAQVVSNATNKKINIP